MRVQRYEVLQVSRPAHRALCMCHCPKSCKTTIYGRSAITDTVCHSGGEQGGLRAPRAQRSPDYPM